MTEHYVWRVNEMADTMNFGWYREIKLLDHVMKIVERIYERIQKIMIVTRCNLALCLERGQ